MLRSCSNRINLGMRLHPVSRTTYSGPACSLSTLDSWSHPDITTLTDAQFDKQLELVEKALVRILGQAMQLPGMLSVC